MLRKDILRKKSITITLFLFTMLSAMLAAGGTNMIMELTNSMTGLFQKSKVPHFVQMHAGALDPAEIDTWGASHPLVKTSQTAEMIPIDGSSIKMGNNLTAENNSVMDILLVKQNRTFDFLLNLDSRIIQVSEGEIAIPVYYMQLYNMEIGDKVTISNPEQDWEFTVVDFVRDVQMSPSIIHSKRLVLHEADLDALKQGFHEVEYLIEFRLTDISKLNEFRNAYQSSDLPQKGPAIEYPLIKTLNALTDGMVAAVVLLVSLLLVIIALLCIRFTILAVMEEDYREIGVMKALGIGPRIIARIYLLKYAAVAATASAAGYAVSLFLNPLLTANIMLYMGTAPKPIWLHVFPIAAVVLIFLIIVIFCMAALRKFNRISAVEALRSGSIGEAQSRANSITLNKNGLSYINVPVFLGAKDVFGRFKQYGILGLVFLLSSFILIVPVNFLNTVRSPDFINYLGIERSDIRIDLQQSEHIVKDFERVIGYLEQDRDVERFSPVVTSKLKVINSEGIEENLAVEIGDFTVFPLEYLQGTAPMHDNEIALSYLNSKELHKDVGDPVRLVINGQENEMTVSGIYQDITNGGRTAKALLPFQAETVIWYKVSVDMKPHVELSTKMGEYAQMFYPAKVTDLEGYLAQTLGNTIEQLQLLTYVAVGIALFAAVLMTSLFLNMLLAKDSSQIAIMRSIGFSGTEIRTQYVTRALLVLGIGLLAGTLTANTIGQSMVSALLSFMGVSQLRFTIDPVQAYLQCPLALIMVVTLTAILNTVSIHKSSIAGMNAE